jgi:hypothetical protein
VRKYRHPAGPRKSRSSLVIARACDQKEVASCRRGSAARPILADQPRAAHAAGREIDGGRLRAESGVPAEGKPRELGRLAVADEQAERECVGERDDLQLRRGGPRRGQVPALERAPCELNPRDEEQVLPGRLVGEYIVERPAPQLPA